MADLIGAETHCNSCPWVTGILSVLFIGSGMNSLDGLIGAEEQVINSKNNINDNVVRTYRPACRTTRSPWLTCPEMQLCFIFISCHKTVIARFRLSRLPSSGTAAPHAFNSCYKRWEKSLHVLIIRYFLAFRSLWSVFFNASLIRFLCTHALSLFYNSYNCGCLLFSSGRLLGVRFI